MKIEIPIDTGFYQSYSSPLSSQACYNLYPHNPQAKGAQSSGVLFPTEGISIFTSVEGICRGMYVFNDILFSVNGTSLYQINKNGTVLKKGMCQVRGV